MKLRIQDTIRARRRALGLSQTAVARRSGIQQRQVSVVEHGGDVTLSTLLKLTQALDLDLIALPREDTPKLQALVSPNRKPTPSPTPASLLDRYQVKDDEEPSRG